MSVSETKPLLQQDDGDFSYKVIPEKQTPTPCVYEKKEMSQGDRQAITKLSISLCLAFLFMIAEMVGGYLANSVAVFSDASHLLSDVAAYFISIGAIYMANRESNANMTWGYKRAEILGAVSSVLLIWAITGYLVVEAIYRLTHKSPVNGKIMFMTASLGVGINILLGMVLMTTGHGHSHGLGLGGDHGHSHGGSHGHSDNHDDHHSHSHDDHHGHSHDNHHSHSHDDHHSHSHDDHHSHSHDDKHHHSHDDHHGHSHDDKHQSPGKAAATVHEEDSHGDEDSHSRSHSHSHGNDDHGHSHNHGNDDHGHSHNHGNDDHGHSHDHGNDDHGHSHNHQTTHGHHSNSLEHLHERTGEIHSGHHHYGSSTSLNIEEDRVETHVEENINLRAAFLHVITDLIQSIAVTIAGALIWWDEERFLIADPICTLLFSVGVCITTFRLIKEIVDVIMMRTPNNVNVEELRNDLTQLDPHIKEVHCLHVWAIAPGRIAMSCHMTLEILGNIPLCTDSLIQDARSVCERKYKIGHCCIEIRNPNHCLHSELPANCRRNKILG